MAKGTAGLRTRSAWRTRVGFALRPRNGPAPLSPSGGGVPAATAPSSPPPSRRPRLLPQRGPAPAPQQRGHHGRPPQRRTHELVGLVVESLHGTARHGSARPGTARLGSAQPGPLRSAAHVASGSATLGFRRPWPCQEPELPPGGAASPRPPAGDRDRDRDRDRERDRTPAPRPEARGRPPTAPAPLRRPGPAFPFVTRLQQPCRPIPVPPGASPVLSEKPFPHPFPNAFLSAVPRLPPPLRFWPPAMLTRMRRGREESPVHLLRHLAWGPGPPSSHQGGCPGAVSAWGTSLSRVCRGHLVLLLPFTFLPGAVLLPSALSLPSHAGLFHCCSSTVYCYYSVYFLIESQNHRIV